MHVLSELQNPLFDAPERQRALQVLRMSRLLKEDNSTRAWTVVKAMIDRVVAQQLAPQQSRSQPSSVYPSPTTATMPNNSMSDQVPSYMDRPQPYFQSNTGTYGVATSQPVQHPQPFQSVEPLDSQFTWDDVNLNHIAGDPSQQNAELPEFDWVCLLNPDLLRY
jgi:hypothetical protein